jgi:hypothetical protein
MFDHRAIVRYWERRRILFLLLLIPPAGIGYLPPAAISAGVGDRPIMSIAQVVFVFMVCFLLANLCYTFVYAIEFLVINTRMQRVYSGLRPWILVLGIVLGIAAAFLAAQAIYFMEYDIDPVTGRFRR